MNTDVEMQRAWDWQNQTLRETEFDRLVYPYSQVTWGQYEDFLRLIFSLLNGRELKTVLPPTSNRKKQQQLPYDWIWEQQPK